MREASRPQTERWISAVNYSELLVAPLKEGKYGCLGTRLPRCDSAYHERGSLPCPL